MTTTDDRDLDLVRKSARELARRFDLGYWREKDKKGEYPWEFVKAFADGGWIGAAVAARPQAEWASIYEGTDACVTPVLTFDEAARHPHNAERGVFERVGSVLHPSPAPRFSRTPARSPAAPETGPVDARRLLESWCAREIAAAEVARG